MPAQKISIDNAKHDKLFYFVANVVIYREEDQRCLILKRDEREKVHPGKWCTPGGKLEWKDLDIAKPTRMNGDVIDFENSVEKLLVREAKEEAGVDIEGPYHYINSNAFIRPDETPVVLIKLTARYIRGEVQLEKGAFTDFAWVSAEEIDQYDCVEGVKEEIKKAVNLYSVR